MNWNMIEGKWKELAGSVKEKWGDMTDDEITEMQGSRDKLEGVIQRKYGVTQEAAGKQIDDWAGKLKDTVKD